MDPDYVFDLFNVPRTMRSDAMRDEKPTSTMASFGVQFMTSPNMPPGKAYVIGVDPTDSDAGTVVMVDEASEVLADVARRGRKNGIAYTDWVARQFQTLERFIEQYSRFVPHNTNNPKEKYTMDMSGIARMRADLEEMLTKFTSMVAVVERFGGEPRDGTVIKFEHEFDTAGRDGTNIYDYVAIRKVGKWYVTGRPLGGRAVKWAELLEFIGDGRAWVVEGWREVPVPGASAASADEDLTEAVASVLAARGGSDVKEVAAEVAALLKSKKD